MTDFGKRLRAVREGLALDGPAVAEAALGKDSSHKQRRAFANYLSRIERNKVPRVGLPQLDLIRKGLGFQSLAAFFAEIEDSQKLALRDAASRDIDSLGPRSANPVPGGDYGPTVPSEPLPPDEEREARIIARSVRIVREVDAANRRAAMRRAQKPASKARRRRGAR